MTPKTAITRFSLASFLQYTFTRKFHYISEWWFTRDTFLNQITSILFSNLYIFGNLLTPCKRSNFKFIEILLFLTWTVKVVALPFDSHLIRKSAVECDKLFIISPMNVLPIAKIVSETYEAEIANLKAVVANVNDRNKNVWIKETESLLETLEGDFNIGDFDQAANALTVKMESFHNFVNENNMGTKGIEEFSKRFADWKGKNVPHLKKSPTNELLILPTDMSNTYTSKTLMMCLEDSLSTPSNAVVVFDIVYEFSKSNCKLGVSYLSDSKYLLELLTIDKERYLRILPLLKHCGIHRIFLKVRQMFVKTLTESSSRYLQLVYAINHATDPILFYLEEKGKIPCLLSRQGFTTRL